MSRNSSFKSFFFILQLLTSIVCLHCSVALKTVLMSHLCDKNSSPYIHLASLESGILKTDFDSEADVDCEVFFIPQARASVVFSFYSYDLPPGDRLTITDYENHKIGLKDAGSFQDERKSFISDGIMSLHYSRNRTAPRRASGGFQLTFTHTNNEPTCISSKEFQCHNKKCIDKRLACDGHNHCGDNSDQQDCQPKTTSYEVKARSTGVVFVILISVGALALLIVIVVFTVYAVRIRKKREAAKHSAAQTTAETGKTGEGELPTISANDPAGAHAPALYPHFGKDWSQPPTAPGFEDGHSNAGFSET